MGFLKEFRDFAVKGNAIDMAVGVIVGAAFGKVVSSLVSDIITPLLGLLTSDKMNFSSLVLNLYDEKNPLMYGKFLDATINFLIVSFVIFIVIRQINRVRIPFLRLGKEEKVKIPATRECPFCCNTIAIKATRCPSCTSILTDDTPC